MRVLPAGPDAVLLDFSDDEPATGVEPGGPLHAARVLRAAAARDRSGPTIADVIPSAQTVLVQAHPGTGIDVLGIHRELRAAAAESVGEDPDDSPEVEIPVVYDGADLADVAAGLSVTVEQVVTRHVDTVWIVQFMGFAPGFGYLVPADASSAHPFDGVGRRTDSRPRVPSGSVAVAAGYSAVYPRESPGGWHLLGHTDIGLWDETTDPPALLAPGRRVRFVRVQS